MKYIILILLLTGCYTPRKASQQFSRAVAFDPALPANYCARAYPPHDTTIHDTTTHTDTAYYPPEFVTDTVRDHDTVTITNTIVKPGQVVTRTITIRDTMLVTNTAALDACKIDNSKLVSVIGPITADRDKYRKRSRTLFWILLAAGAVIGAGVYSKVAGIFKPHST